MPSAAGSPVETLSEALTLLSGEGFAVQARAPWVRSPAYPPGAGPDFVNGAALVETEHAPEQALAALHRVEQALGRRRVTRYAPRVVDLDLLVWGDRIAPDPETLARWIALPPERWTEETPDRLLLPHPRLQDRAFALGPLCAIWPDWRHPLLKRSAADLWAALPEPERASLSPLDA